MTTVLWTAEGLSFAAVFYGMVLVGCGLLIWTSWSK